MKVGSLVECVDNKPTQPLWVGNFPVIEDIYTVKSIIECDCGCGCGKQIYLCEVEELEIKKYELLDIECWHYQFWYIQVQPPTDISDAFDDNVKVENLNGDKIYLTERNKNYILL